MIKNHDKLFDPDEDEKSQIRTFMKIDCNKTIKHKIFESILRQSLYRLPLELQLNIENNQNYEVLRRIKENYLQMETHRKLFQRELAVQTRCLAYRIHQDGSLRYVDACTGNEVSPNEYEYRYKCYLSAMKNQDFPIYHETATSKSVTEALRLPFSQLNIQETSECLDSIGIDIFNPIMNEAESSFNNNNVQSSAHITEITEDVPDKHSSKRQKCNNTKDFSHPLS